MSDLTDLISRKGTEQATQGIGATAWFATVAAPAPTSTSDDLWVIIPDLSLDVTYKWGPCRWSSNTVPNAGDPCLVTFDNRQQLWAQLAKPETAPTYPVTSVFSRTGAVVAVNGDYSVAQVTGAAPLASPALTDVPTAPTAAPDTNTTQLATTAFIAAALAALVLTPTGAVIPFAGTVAPTGWLLCDGSSVLRATYPTLFGVIGTTYGAVDGTHFNLPDMNGNIPVGKDVAAPFTVLGATGGEINHTLSATEMPSHTHTFTGTALGTHSHTFTGTAMGNHTHANTASFSGSAMAAHTHSDSAGTPAGTVASHSHASVSLGAGLTYWEDKQVFPTTGAGVAITNMGTDSVGNGGFTTSSASGHFSNPVTSAVAPAFTGTAMTAHTHSDSAGTPAGTVTMTNAGASAGTPAGTLSSDSAGTPAGTNANTGGGAAHNNLQPYIVLNYLIRT